jgi:predicted permease
MAYAVKSLRRTPGPALAVLVTISTATGGIVAIYSVVDRVFFRTPHAIHEPKELHRLFARQHSWRGEAYVTEDFSYPDYRDLVAAVRGTAAITAYGTGGAALQPSGQRIGLSYVSPDYFSLLGVRPSRGRFFTDADARPGSGERLAVLSFDFWRNALGGDSNSLSRPLTVDGTSYTIIGVAAPGFRGLDLSPVDVWVALGSVAAAGEGRWHDRNARFLQLVMRSAADPRTLEKRLTAAFRAAQIGSSWADPRAGVIAAPLAEARAPRELLPIEERSISLIQRLCVIVGAVLLIAVTNSATVMLLRTLRRRHEVSIRIALGMSRARMLEESLAELGLLTLLTAFLAVAVGSWGSRFLQATLLPAVRGQPLTLDARNIFLAGGLAAAAVLLAGLGPLGVMVRARPDESLRSGGATNADTSSRSLAIIGGTALSIVLISVAGAFLLSIHRATPGRLGFDGSRLVAVIAGMTTEGAITSSLGNIRALPSVASAANAYTELPPGGAMTGFATSPDAPDSIHISYNAVDTAYFRTVGLTPVRGRLFDRTDTRGSEPVVIVTESAAARYWPAQDPIGRCAHVFANRGTCRRVVGVVPDIRWNLSRPPEPHFYVPISHAPNGFGRVILVRTRGRVTVADLMQITKAASGADSAGSAPRVYRIADRFDLQLRPLLGASTLLLALAALVVVSASAGMYSKMSYDASRRTRELGVRAAFGASQSELVGLLLRAGTRLLATGIALGVVAVVAARQLTERFLFDTSTLDPLMLSTVVGIMFVSGVLAMSVAAYQATRLNPADALRYE